MATAGMFMISSWSLVLPTDFNVINTTARSVTENVIK